MFEKNRVNVIIDIVIISIVDSFTYLHAFVCTGVYVMKMWPKRIVQFHRVPRKT